MGDPGNSAAEVVVCGLSTVDIVARPVSLDQAVGAGQLVPIERVEVTTGGIVSNSGIALAKLGIRTAAVTLLGNDSWAELILRRYKSAGLEVDGLLRHDALPTSATVVLVSAEGQRSFLFSRGAAPQLSVRQVADQLHRLGRCSWLLLGYFSLFPEFDRQLPDLLRSARSLGYRTALDCAGTGGKADVLQPVLPLLDLYVPSLDEAIHQTGISEPVRILERFRAWGSAGTLGLKLGSRGAILSPAAGEYIELPAIVPPQPIVDTTGAGDAFYAGLIAGLLRGQTLVDAGRIGAAAGAACATALGATAGLLDWNATRRLAGLD